MKKEKSLNWGPKVPDLGILVLEFESSIVIFEIGTFEFFRNRHPRICLIAKFSEKTKMPKFGTKMLYLGIFGQEFLKNVF